MIIAHARRLEARSSITFRSSGLRRAERCASRKLCQTTQSLAIGYWVEPRECHSIDLAAGKHGAFNVTLSDLPQTPEYLARRAEIAEHGAVDGDDGEAFAS